MPFRVRGEGGVLGGGAVHVGEWGEIGAGNCELLFSIMITSNGPDSCFRNAFLRSLQQV